MNEEQAYLSQFSGITAVKSKGSASTDYLKGLILRQPMTEAVVQNLNKENYHWLCHSEFSWFLAEALPIAYGLFLKNELEFVVSFEGSEPFFIFLPLEKFSIAMGTNPNTLDGSPPYLASKIYEKEYKSISPYWSPPPLKNLYRNLIKFNLTKPLIVINNKLTEEWSEAPINCLHENELRELLIQLKDKYAIGYIRAQGNEKGYCNDRSKILEQNDFSIVKQYATEVVFAQDLISRFNIPFNFAQCLIHAQSDIHISSAGGNSILASYFGGTNIIIGRGEKFEQRQIWHENSWLKNLSGSKILSVNLKNNFIKSISDIC